jgi:2-polyprenyl-3-methyl-5-hydroxy-6-metoxy-1,4-benzoquinol methylase
LDLPLTKSEQCFTLAAALMESKSKNIAIQGIQMDPKRRFTWEEMKEYWRTHSSRWADIDYSVDPDGLENVCFPGAPLRLNQYHARSQMSAYEKLLSRLPTGSDRKRALEVGCGAGRWCRFLAERGWETIGIDLQPELIEMNRVRYPHIEFYCTPVQEYSDKEPFDFISAVTVIQHIPFDEQDVVLRKFRDLIRIGGHVIMLDSIHYQTPHVFSHTVKGWRAKVEKAGFRCIAIQRYDYNPFQRFQSWLVHRLMLILGRAAVYETIITPADLVTPRPTSTSASGVAHKNFFGKLGEASANLSLLLDTSVEPLLVRSNIGLNARHCGFLFRAI